MQPTPQRKSNRFLWPVIFFIIVVILSVNAGLAINTLQGFTRIQQSLSNTDSITVRLKDLHITVLAAESGQRGFLITDNEDYLLPYEKSLADLDKKVADVRTIQSEIEGQQPYIGRLLALVQLKIIELQTVVETAKANREIEAVRMVMTDRGRNLYREMDDIFDFIEEREFTHHNFLLESLSKNREEATLVFIISGTISFMLVLGLVALAFLSMRRDDRYHQQLQEINTSLQEKVTERTKELEVYSEELARSNRELEDFAFVASHDLQEPLRKIQAFGERIETQYAPDMPDTAKDYLRRMRNAAQRMSELITDLLEYSRVASRATPFVSVNLNEVLKSVLDDLEVAIEESEAHIENTTLPKVMADPSQMRQLLQNLISNALKFHKPDSVPMVRIDYHAPPTNQQQLETQSPSHVISVSDQGVGFEQQFADKIFIPFQRLHSRNAYKGTGIGLAVCRKIVEHHGGQISATSSVGQGTCIRFTLPTSQPVSKE